MEHRQKLVVLGDTVSESALPASVVMSKGQAVRFQSRDFTVANSDHELSDDGEVMTTTHYARPAERESLNATQRSEMEMVSLDMA